VSTSFYDVVVLGSDLGATVGGAVLAHRGFRVLVAGVPAEERYAIGPYTLPRAPLAFVGTEAPTLKRIVGELNLVQLLRRRLEPNRPAFQLLLPDHRLDVGDDLMRELARELPDSAAGFEAAAARTGEVAAALESILGQDLILPPDGFWDRRDANRVAARLPEDDEDVLAAMPANDPMRAAFTLPARFGAAWDRVGPVATARLADLHRKGTFRLDGGREGLRGLLLDRLKTHAGEVRPELVPRAILSKRGKVTGVAFEGRSEIVGAGHVIAGAGADRVAEWVAADGDKVPKRLAEAATIKPVLWRYLLHLVAPLDALPDALGRLAFAVEDLEKPLVGANALMLHLADGYGQHAVLSVEALAEDPSPDALAKLRRAIRARLERLLPFVDRHLLLVHSPHDGIAPEGVDGERSGLSTTAAMGPVPMEPVWGMDGPRALGFCGLPHASGVKHLLLASRQVMPGLGVEGELAAGWAAARIVLQTERKRDLVKGAVLEG
jgi:phytoene dehydrogenase-like protein